jgi:2-oxoglutarate dehydrogenase E2 component (dihydrolipoamide succinyltransferase)
MATDVHVPTLGESITEGTLANWLKKPGEAVAADEPIAELETDKVSVEVPSPVAGVLAEQVVKQGDTVAVGAVIARIDEGATAAAPAPAMAQAEAATNPPGAGETPMPKGEPTAPVAEAEEDHITTLSPAVRRAVLELHVDPSKIKGTGKDGRLTKDDVIAAAEAQKSAAPAPEAKAPAQPASPEAKAPPPAPRWPQ